MSEPSRIEVYADRDDPSSERVTSLLDTEGIDYVRYDVAADRDRLDELAERAGGRDEIPAVFVDGELVDGLDELRALAESGELDAPSGRESAVEHRRLIVAGSGIAGLSAAIYAGRAHSDPLVLEGIEPGGQLTLTTEVENYPGFPDGITGPELIQRMKRQAEKFGAEIQHGVVESVDASNRPLRVTLTSGDAYTTDALIAASGASARTLEVPGEDNLMGYGVSTCATCDGAFFRDEEMLVVGGGDAAMEEANFLTRFAEKVYIAHRRARFRAEDYWIDRIMEKVDAGEIEILWNTEVTGIRGSPEGGVDTVDLVRHPDGHPKRKLDDPATEAFDLDVGAVFLAIGHTPNTEYLEGTGVELDDSGYILTEGGRGAGQTQTGVPGIFGAGDVVDFYYQQAVTAGGMGVEAALDADDYLEALDRGVEPAAAGAAVAETDD